MQSSKTELVTVCLVVPHLVCLSRRSCSFIMAEQRRVSFNDVSLLLFSTFSSGVPNSAMDVSTSLKMSSLTTQSLFSYVEEENLSAIKAHLDKYREVDTRSEVSAQELLNITSYFL